MGVKGFDAQKPVRFKCDQFIKVGGFGIVRISKNHPEPVHSFPDLVGLTILGKA